MRSPLLLLAAAPLFGACSSPTPLTLIITAGQETDAFTACDVNSVNIDITSLDGSVNVSEDNLKPGASFDFGDIEGSEQVTVAVTGYDASNAVVMQGSSLAALLLDSFQGGIPVFVECVNTWSRPPGALVQSHVNGVAFVETEEYLDLTGGTAPKGAPSTDTTELDAYDLGTLDGASTAAFDIVPLTSVSIGDQVLLIDSATATWVDFSAQTQTDDVAPPTGIDSFSAVAGGQVIVAPDNSAMVARWFVVGGTRANGATSAVLEVDGDESLLGYNTIVPREGATATWIQGVGLVVAGGSTASPGVEILADGASGFTQTAFPADPTVGAGAVPDATGGMLLFGGLVGSSPAPTRRLPSLTCETGSTCTEMPPLMLPGLTNVSAYAVGGGNSIVVGTDSTAPFLNRTFYASLNTSKVVEMPLREPRSGATPLPTPTGTLAILGGQHTDGTPALNVELLFPATTLP